MCRPIYKKLIKILRSIFYISGPLITLAIVLEVDLLYILTFSTQVAILKALRQNKLVRMILSLDYIVEVFVAVVLF